MSNPNSPNPFNRTARVSMRAQERELDAYRRAALASRQKLSDWIRTVLNSAASRRLKDGS